MKKSILTIYLIGFILLLGAAAQPVLGSDWPQFQKDEVNIGVTNDSAPIEVNSTLSWSHDLVDVNQWAGIDVPPVVYGDYVYVVTADGDVWKYYKNGTAAGGNWPVSFETVGGAWPYTPQNAAPAAGNGYIYVLNTGYNSDPLYDLHVIYADNGSFAYNVTVINSTSVQFSTPITYVEDNNGSKHILFGSVNMSAVDPVNLSDGGKYYCYNATNLSEEWERSCSSANGYYGAGAAIIGNYAVYGDDAGHLVSVEYTNFANNVVTTIQDIDTATIFGFNVGEIRSSICYSATTGKIYFTSKDGYCCAVGFNANTGHFTNYWTSYIGSSTSTPVYYNGRIYVGSGTGLFCLNATNGNQIWSNNNINPVQSSPAISAFYGPGNEYIYVTTNSATGGLYCVDSNGNIVWSETSPGSSNNYCLAGAAISGGWVFYGNDDGYLRGCANYTRYDFAVRASDDKWAYKYQVANVKPTINTVPTTEFTTAEYVYIASCGEGENVTSETTSGYAAHRFVFKIDDNEKPWITSLTVKWCGMGWNDGGDDGVYLYIWNHSSSQYEELANSSTDAYGCLSGVVYNASDYIDASGNVTVLAVQKGQDTGRKHSNIETDCVKLVATP